MGGGKKKNVDHDRVTLKAVWMQNPPEACQTLKHVLIQKYILNITLNDWEFSGVSMDPHRVWWEFRHHQTLTWISCISVHPVCTRNSDRNHSYTSSREMLAWRGSVLPNLLRQVQWEQRFLCLWAILMGSTYPLDMSLPIVGGLVLPTSKCPISREGKAAFYGNRSQTQAIAHKAHKWGVKCSGRATEKEEQRDMTLLSSMHESALCISFSHSILLSITPPLQETWSKHA